MSKASVVIVGGGIVGLATAWQWGRSHPNESLILLEKEDSIAKHQTGHNSGVLHSGIYYKPGSMKAINCRQGKKLMEKFCRDEEITYEICGKVIVATREEEMPALEQIFSRGQANGVNCEKIDQSRLKELEPHVNGISGIHVPEAGIVDYSEVCVKLQKKIQEQGNQIICSAKVLNIHQSNSEIILETTIGEVRGNYLVNCAGLYSDKVMGLTSQKTEMQIVPFRGEYYYVKPEKEYLCKNLIYPVPDPAFPFLGVHFTRMIHGGLECGPNAVLAFAREGYKRSDLNFSELLETLKFTGFQKLALKYWQMGMGEMWRSWYKPAFVKALQRLVPEITAEDLIVAPAGVRAQAVTKDGSLVDDFLIDETENVLNICNAPSPAATASLNIGRLVSEKLAIRFV